ncbi:hypothetical protein [Alicyclobacillus tolerans]|uniref:Uncharacterized protein n=1 Tax=Alicyclobacillus tolerans TaxID=90970 RepID=A0A1M6TQQ9_9BACL|nr:hypothetical protein [Alicyclobacillus montanus]SHK59274.1 hypothetical protein SAMN05443507_11746 [Alicyclobacillus montanus]
MGECEGRMDTLHKSVTYDVVKKSDGAYVIAMYRGNELVEQVLSFKSRDFAEQVALSLRTAYLARQSGRSMNWRVNDETPGSIDIDVYEGNQFIGTQFTVKSLRAAQQIAMELNNAFKVGSSDEF